VDAHDSIATILFAALEMAATRATLLTWTDRDGEGSVVIVGYVDLTKAAEIFLSDLKAAGLG
jgi:hypothetical protein